MATLIVVRRDANETFQHLEGAWARTGSHVTIIWDRRTNDRRHADTSIPVERRVGERREVDAEWPGSLNETRRADRRQQPELRMPERRRTQRRRRPPAVWGTLGFLVVRGEGGEA